MSINNILTYLKLDRRKILSILKREEELRFSKEYISQCNEVANIPNAWLDVTSKMQEDLVKEFGYTELVSNILAVHVIRKAQDIYPNDEEIKNSVVKFRENLANPGTFKEGDNIVDISLHNLVGSKINLFDILDSNKPNIILAGSHT